MKFRFRHGPLHGQSWALALSTVVELKQQKSFTIRGLVYIYVEPDILLFAGKRGQIDAARIKRGDMEDPAVGSILRRSKKYR
ncbi:MAG: hypothetical protein ACREQA_19705 [Candidatus Binatia bacterium]